MRVPREFRYWSNLERGYVRAARAGSRRILGFDPAPPDAVAEAFAAMYFDADPIAEAFVDEAYFDRSPRQGREMLDRAIASGAQSVTAGPPSLRALFDDLESEPPWLDREQVELGARVFRRYGPDVFRFAGAITLMAYSESSVAKPLALSGGYVGSSTKRRFLETAAFWIAVSEPGGLDRWGAGFASAVRVRIMHVVVRRRLLAHPDWRVEEWGVPISQADAMLTLMGGSFAPGIALCAMGYRTSKHEIEALMHFWRYVGHLMGVRPRWYPTTLSEATQLAFLSALKAAGSAGDDGRALCRSYVDAFAPDERAAGSDRLRQALADRVHRGFTRFFLPSSMVRRNRLPPAGAWALLPLAAWPFFFTAETARRHVPRLELVADRVARWRRDRWFAVHNQGRRAEYRPTERLTR